MNNWDSSLNNSTLVGLFEIDYDIRKIDYMCEFLYILKVSPRADIQEDMKRLCLDKWRDMILFLKRWSATKAWFLNK